MSKSFGFNASNFQAQSQQEDPRIAAQVSEDLHAMVVGTIDELNEQNIKRALAEKGLSDTEENRKKARVKHVSGASLLVDALEGAMADRALAATLAEEFKTQYGSVKKPIVATVSSELIDKIVGTLRGLADPHDEAEKMRWSKRRNSFARFVLRKYFGLDEGDESSEQG